MAWLRWLVSAASAPWLASCTTAPAPEPDRSASTYGVGDAIEIRVPVAASDPGGWRIESYDRTVLDIEGAPRQVAHRDGSAEFVATFAARAPGRASVVLASGDRSSPEMRRRVHELRVR